jgi:hypothetical protein
MVWNTQVAFPMKFIGVFIQQIGCVFLHRAKMVLPLKSAKINKGENKIS